MGGGLEESGSGGQQRGPIACVCVRARVTLTGVMMSSCVSSLRSRASEGPPSDLDTRQPGRTTVTPRAVTRQPLEDCLGEA